MGYDISPDMVRLSLVNLYLHGFSDPHIWEYDTLSSEDRWNESFDVILANPPFMSPKGGIRPHKKFSISSNRSEVLFVDYIAEHLNPKGRAGIIVPEGVIFQSGTAYKDLRKMLVENYLYAVVSLPAGIFNPYSGVKTSILLMGKEFAKTSKEILFVKVDNDGFNLGAQRNAIKGGQLANAIEILKNFKEGTFTESYIAHSVQKSEIAINGDYNLSGERYKQQILISSDYELKKLEEICTVMAGGTPSRDEPKYWGGKIPWVGSGVCKNIIVTESEEFITEEGLKNSAAKVFKAETSLIALVGATIGKTGFLSFDCTTNQNVAGLYPLDLSVLNPKYLFFALKKLYPQFLNLGEGKFRMANLSFVRGLQIPLPPLFVQQEVVAEIEAYQKIIDGAKMVVENYKPKIDINPKWEMVELGDVCDMNPKKSELSAISDNTEVSFVPMADINENQIDFIPKKAKPISEVIKGYTYFKENDVLLAKVTPCFENGKAGIAKNLKNGIGFGSSEYFVLRPNDKILSTWIYLNVITKSFREQGKLNMTGTGGLQRVPPDFVKKTVIPLPDIKTQHQIVSQIEKEQELVNANKQLIETFEQKIKDRIAKVWGE